MTLSRLALVLALLATACGSPDSGELGEPQSTLPVDETGTPPPDEDPAPPADEPLPPVDEDPAPPPVDEEPAPPPVDEPAPPPVDEPAPPPVDEPAPPPVDEPAPPPVDEEPVPPPTEPPPSADTDLDDPIDANAPRDDLLALAVFEATNDARAGEGLGALRHCGPCEDAAQQHADDMVRLDFFSHTNPDPDLASAGDRLSAAGLSGYTAWAENIANYPARSSTGMHTYRSFAAYVVGGWMDSSGHRANILSDRMTHLGAACALDNDGSPRLKCVQDFVRLSSSL